MFSKFAVESIKKVFSTPETKNDTLTFAFNLANFPCDGILNFSVSLMYKKAVNNSNFCDEIDENESLYAIKHILLKRKSKDSEIEKEEITFHQIIEGCYYVSLGKGLNFPPSTPNLNKNGIQANQAKFTVQSNADTRFFINRGNKNIY